MDNLSWLGLIFDEFSSFCDDRTEIGMTSKPGIYNTDDQCYEFRVTENILSSFRLSQNNENPTNTSPKVGTRNA